MQRKMRNLKLKKPNNSIHKKNTSKEQHQTRLVTHHSGPLPPAESLKTYEEILPGITDRIMTMTENDINHTHEINCSKMKLNSKGLNLAYFTAILGQILSFLIMLIFLICGFTLIYFNKPITGTIFSGVSAFAMIFSLIYQVLNKNKLKK